MHIRQIEEARALATPVIHNFADVDKFPWMVAQYVPSLGTGGSSASIAYIVASSMTFLVNGSTPADADAIGASGVVLTSSSTYNTMGKLVDYISGRAAWRAYLVGALRADLSSLMLVKTAAICSGANGLTFYADSSASGEHSLAISGEKFVSNAASGHVKDADDFCENEMLYGAFDVTNASAIGLRYYSGKQGDTETQVGSTVSLTTGANKEQGEVNLTVPFVQATRGQRLIMRCLDLSTTVAELTAPVIHVIGKTAVLANNRTVDEINY